MATPFARSLRSLNVDSPYASLIGLLVVMTLLVMWGLWFFGAKISLYRSSDQAQVSHLLFVTAQFSGEQAGQIKIGQPATFYPGDVVQAPDGPIPAIVTEVRPTAGGPTEVTLALRPERRLSNSLPPGLAGRVEIEVERVSPANFALRRGGLSAAATPGRPESN
jgi:hypothetical protein